MLEDMGRAFAFPQPPDMSAAVMSRLAERPRAAQPRPWRLAAGAAAVVVLVAALVATVSSNVREAVADFLGLAVEGERIEVLPTPPPNATATPFPTPVRLDQIAEKVSREVAVKRAGFEPRLPTSLGEPRAFYVLSYAGQFIVVADYGAAQVWEFPLAGEIFVGKGLIGGGRQVAPVTVNGQPGYWIAEGQRIVTVNNVAGTPQAGSARTVTGEALIWSEGGLYRRIEGVASRADALAIAAEMR